MTLLAGRVRAVALLAGAAGTLGCYGGRVAGNPLDGLTGDQRDAFRRGTGVFTQVFTPGIGLGPLFNSVGCTACHNQPVPGGGGPITIVIASVLRPDGFCDPLTERGGPVFQLAVTPALKAAMDIDAEPIPPEADRGRRTTPDVFGVGLLDAVPESTMLALADPDDADGDGISGRVNRFFDGRIGRFGRKALTPTLAEFNEGAFHEEQGLTVPNILGEGTVGGLPIPPGVDPTPEPEVSAELLALTNAYVGTLAPARPGDLDGTARRGQRLFATLGCARCHVPSLRTGDHPIRALAHREVAAYTDLLLHDMGPELADVCQGLVATPSEFRTEPLMALRLARRYLHDGRAGTIEEAVRLHGGEAARSRDAFGALSESDRRALLRFLDTL
ncbi:MAG: di-heme oxidoredictase family protein [Gemmatimonadales bacterium]